MSAIRVLICDDHPIVRQGVRSVLANHPDIQVVGEAENASTLFAIIDSLKPDVVLVDIRMPGQGGIEITQRLKRDSPDIKVIVLSTYDDDEYLFGALRAGAEGYLLKSASQEVLADSIRQVGRGERLLSPNLMGKVMREFRDLAKDKARAESGLTDQEVEVLQMIAAGATNK
jgi:two-component system response regulator DevR